MELRAFFNSRTCPREPRLTEPAGGWCTQLGGLSFAEAATSNSRSSQPSGSLCCGRRWYFQKPALSTDQFKLKVILRSLLYIHTLNVSCIMLVYYFVPFIVNNLYLLFKVSNGHNSVTIQNQTHVSWNFFLSQRPRKSPPAVMSTSRETLCISYVKVHIEGCPFSVIGSTIERNVSALFREWSLWDNPPSPDSRCLWHCLHSGSMVLGHKYSN